MTGRCLQASEVATGLWSLVGSGGTDAAAHMCDPSVGGCGAASRKRHGPLPFPLAMPLWGRLRTVPAAG